MTNDYEMMASNQIIRANLELVKKNNKQFTVDEEAKVIKNSPLSEVKGIGEVTIKKLIDAGVNTTDDLKSLSKEAINEIIKNPISRGQIENYLLNK